MGLARFVALVTLTRVTAMKNCPQCGKAIDQQMDLCPNCGYAVESPAGDIWSQALHDEPPMPLHPPAQTPAPATRRPLLTKWQLGTVGTGALVIGAVVIMLSWPSAEVPTPAPLTLPAPKPASAPKRAPQAARASDVAAAPVSAAAPGAAAPTSSSASSSSEESSLPDTAPCVRHVPPYCQGGRDPGCPCRECSSRASRTSRFQAFSK